MQIMAGQDFDLPTSFVRLSGSDSAAIPHGNSGLGGSLYGIRHYVPWRFRQAKLLSRRH